MLQHDFPTQKRRSLIRASSLLVTLVLTAFCQFQAPADHAVIQTLG